MVNNQLSDFTDYISNLCVKHVDILHVPGDEDHRHFIELNDEQQLQESKSICYPLVAMDKLTVSYNGQQDSPLKNRYVEIMFIDSVSDTGDFIRIQEVKNSMERIAEDFIKKMKTDRKDRNVYPFLKCMVLSKIELNFIENKAINLYGALLSFNFELPFSETLEVGRFN